jgi:cell division protein FtsB
MTVGLEIKRIGRQVAGAVVGCLLIGYFLFHTVQGERGLLSWVQLKQKLAYQELEHDRAFRERRKWEDWSNSLRPEALDRDLLDERVRAVTAYGREDELVILLPQEKD